MFLTLLSNQTAPPAGNIIWLKVSGTWKQATPFIKVGGTWKQATIFIKDAGVWK